MNIAVIIVLYNTPQKDIIRLKKEFNSLNFKNYSLFLIDNTNTKKGYAQGVNEGIRLGIKQKAEYFIIANPDISVKNIIIPQELPYDIFSFSMIQNKKQYYCGYLDKWRLSSILSTKKPENKYVNCTYITGSLMIVKKSVFEKIGLFNEKYFMYYEDVEFCVRALKSGFTVGIDSSQTYEHFELSKTNSEKELLMARSRLKFLISYSNVLQKLYEILRLPLTIYESKHLIKWIIRV